MDEDDPRNSFWRETDGLPFSAKVFGFCAVALLATLGLALIVEAVRS